MKIQFTVLLLSVNVIVTDSSVFQDLRRALLESKVNVGEDAKRCLNDMESDTCSGLLQTIIDEDTSTTSETSIEVSSPAPVKDDELGSDLGVPQVIDTDSKSDIVKRITEGRIYYNEVVMKDDKYEKVRDLCQNKNSQCAFWSSIGECEANPGYMQLNCPVVCKSCDLLHAETRCPLDPNAKDALEPGDLNKMFERIVTEPYYKQFEPVTISRPSYAPGDTAENATYDIGMWMVVFNNAISDDEADKLIELGGIRGYERSSDVGAQKNDGTYEKHVNSGRTSTNAWCVDECYTDPAAQAVMKRIENITGIPEMNSENLQLLRYEENQYYQQHNDYIPYQLERPCGVRILTFYFYLNDVDEGGETNFPRIGHKVTPKKGRAVLWPSVFNDDPNKKDIRSDHQAMPVIKGIKYGANAWIHQRDFKTANKLSCT